MAREAGWLSSRNIRHASVPAASAFIAFGLIFSFSFKGDWPYVISLTVLMTLVTFVSYTLILRNKT